MTRDAEGQLWAKLKTLFHDYEARCQKAERYEQVSNLGDDFGRKALDVISAAGFRFVPPDHVVVPREWLKWVYDTLHEINPSNYNHDDVCKLNTASVEVILELAALLSAGEKKL